MLNWTLHKLVIETRYTNGYIYWDKTGFAVKTFLESQPRWELVDATAKESVFVDQIAGLTISISPTQSVVIAEYGGQSKTEFLKQFYSTCKLIAEFTFKEFQIRTVNRLGNRINMRVDTKTEEEAALMLRALSEKLKLGGDLFSRFDDPQLKSKSLKDLVHRFEDEKTGIRLALQPATKKYNVEGPNMQVVAQLLPKPQPFLLFDLDVYTKGLVPVEKILPEEFGASNLRLVESRLLPLFQL